MLTLRLWDTKADLEEIRAMLMPVDIILPSPNHTRGVDHKRDMAELTRSIREYGVLQPIGVRKMGSNSYELIYGARRLEAAKRIGLTEIPAIIIRASDRDSALMALTENIQRKALGFFEEARGYEALINDYGFTIEELSRKTGKSVGCIMNKLKLLSLPDRMQRLIINHRLEEGHARALCRIPHKGLRLRMLIRIMEEDLTVKRANAIADEIISKMSQANEDKPNEDKRITRIVKDGKLYKNTILEAVDFIKKWGADAQCVVNESENAWEIKILIPLT